MRRPVAPPSRAGFTLLEVLVALTIGSVAVLLAASLLRTTSDQLEIVRASSLRADESANGERVLRRLVGQLRWSSADDPRPAGDANRMRFATWCDMPAGWQERCTATLVIADPADGGGVDLTTPHDSVRLLRGMAIDGFLYLSRPEHGLRWHREWLDPGALPSALGVVTPGDTLVIRVGDRG